MSLRSSGSASPSRRAGTPPADPADLTIGSSRDYPAGYSDDVIEEMAAEDGHSQVHVPSLWGDNTEPGTIHVIAAAHGSQQQLIAHSAREKTQTIAVAIEAGLQKFPSAIAVATRATDRWVAAEIARLALSERLRALHLSRPDRWAPLKTTIWLIALFCGDEALIAVAYQVLGLSDRPWVPGWGITDDLHLAALASVIGLVILADLAGARLHDLEIDAEVRRRIPDEKLRAELPKPSRFVVGMVVSVAAAAVLVVLGVGIIRIQYLVDIGSSASAVPFLMIQLGIFCAAVAVGYRYHHPLARQVRAVESGADQKARELNAAVSAADILGGEVNADIDAYDTTIAQAGQHILADLGNVERGVWLAVRRTILAQPEATVERMFPAELPLPTTPSSSDLLETLTGVKPFLTFVKVSTQTLHEHLAKAQTRLRELEAAIAYAELNGLDVSATAVSATALTALSPVPEDEEDAA
jgi:hypothetical protein